MGNKIICATCAHEKSRICTIKKVTIAPNKRRNCDKYKLEASKVKEKQVLKTIQLSYAEREALRQEYKQQLKQLKSAIKGGNLPAGSQVTEKYPLTGDLSRFTSTVAEEKSNG
jgi:hypothetical protein